MNMKRARKSIGISRMHLAESCQRSAGFIGDIELGKRFPSAKSLDRIGEALGLHPHELFYEADKDFLELEINEDTAATILPILALIAELKGKLKILEDVTHRYIREQYAANDYTPRPRT